MLLSPTSPQPPYLLTRQELDGATRALTVPLGKDPHSGLLGRFLLCGPTSGLMKGQLNPVPRMLQFVCWWATQPQDGEEQLFSEQAVQTKFRLYEGGAFATAESLHRARAPGRCKQETGSSWRPGWLGFLLDSELNPHRLRQRLYFPRLNAAFQTLVMWPGEQLSADEAASVLWARLNDWEGWLEPSLGVYSALEKMGPRGSLSEFYREIPAGASLDTQLPLLGRGPSSRVMGTRMEESSFVIKWATCSGSRRAVWEAVCRWENEVSVLHLLRQRFPALPILFAESHGWDLSQPGWWRLAIISRRMDGTVAQLCHRVLQHDEAARLAAVKRVVLAVLEVLAAIAPGPEDGAADLVVTHGDVKAANVLYRVDEAGGLEIRLADFAGAQAISSAPTQAAPDGARQPTIFTMLYAAPELQRGDTQRIGRRTDLWSLGLTALVLLSRQGQQPHWIFGELGGLSNPEADAKVAPHRDAALSAVPGDAFFRILLHQTLRADPDRRPYPTQLLQTLRRLHR